MNANEFFLWQYDKAKHVARDGARWHFVKRYPTNLPLEDQPFEIYFRDDSYQIYGVIRYERFKDFPPKSLPSIINKVMNDQSFREKHLDASTKAIWAKSWK
jgi:hypothetical protein